MKTYRCVFGSGAELFLVASDKTLAILNAKELNPSDPLINVFVEGEW